MGGLLENSLASASSHLVPRSPHTHSYERDAIYHEALTGAGLTPAAGPRTFRTAGCSKRDPKPSIVLQGHLQYWWLGMRR